ncbi:MAG: type II secretion system F family protein [Planctomycetota bacterium]
MDEPAPLALLIAANLLAAAGLFGVVFAGYRPALRFKQRQEAVFDRVLRNQLLVDVEPSTVFWGLAGAISVLTVVTALLTGSWVVTATVFAVACLAPTFELRRRQVQRRKKLERQLVDGLVSLSAAVRAGLNLTQAMQLVAKSHVPPIRDEFGQVLREYEMGLDLNQSMRNASERIGSSLYRLTFTAIEMHRMRGGDSSESLDRIADSVREIQRMEGRLDAITSQGRAQANFMAIMPFALLGILALILPENVQMLFREPVGRVILLVATAMILFAQWWIKRIMRIDL